MVEVDKIRDWMITMRCHLETIKDAADRACDELESGDPAAFLMTYLDRQVDHVKQGAGKAIDHLPLLLDCFKEGRAC